MKPEEKLAAASAMDIDLDALTTETVDDLNGVLDAKNLWKTLDQVYVANQKIESSIEDFVGMREFSDDDEVYDDPELKQYMDSAFEDELSHNPSISRKELAEIAEKRVKDSAFVNLLIIGPPGGGKSTIIPNWARTNGLGIKKLTGAQLTREIVQGIPSKDAYDESKYYILKSSEFDSLNSRRSILFIDELNRSQLTTRASILDMVTSHTFIKRNDKGEEELVRYDNWLFTVAAMNPYEDKNPDKTMREITKLDQAMLNRWVVYTYKYDIKVSIDYLSKQLNLYKAGARASALKAKNSGDEKLYEIKEAQKREYILKDDVLKALKEQADKNVDLNFFNSDLQGISKDLQDEMFTPRSLEMWLRMTSPNRHSMKSWLGNVMGYVITVIKK